MKLLTKSIRSPLIFSAIMLLVAIPFFYFIIQQYVVEDVDESLVVQKERIIGKLGVLHTKPTAFLETLEQDISLAPLHSFYKHDTFYTVKIYDTISKENIPYRILESNIMVGDTPYTIKIKGSLLDSEHLIESIVPIIGILILVITIGFFVINGITAKKTWRPFYNTLDKLHNFQIDTNEPIRLGKTGIDEFTDLNNAITSLTQRSQQVYQSQKEFTENASHELQTPLAILQGKLELLMQTTPLNDEQAGLISDLADTSQRLNRLNKSLLLLTKIENDLFLEKETISIKTLMERLIEQYNFQVEKRNITIQSDYATNTTIVANATLMEILISNLLSNAIRYNRENGLIKISLKENTFTICNTGIDASLDPGKIFGRFQKESTDVQSSGLGLAIVHKITKLYNYDLTYDHTEGMHCFRFRF